MTTTEDLRLSKSNCSAMFDDMTWPTAGEFTSDLEYRLLHGSFRDTDRICAASVIAAYLELVRCPSRKREAVVRQLRKALQLEKAKGGAA